MTPERELWQAVVFQAVIDATTKAPIRPVRKPGEPTATFQARVHTYNENKRIRDDAVSWLTSCGRGLRNACELAGMDPHFISESYRAGRIDRKILKAASETRRAPVEL